MKFILTIQIFVNIFQKPMLLTILSFEFALSPEWWWNLQLQRIEGDMRKSKGWLEEKYNAGAIFLESVEFNELMHIQYSWFTEMMMIELLLSV